MWSNKKIIAFITVVTWLLMGYSCNNTAKTSTTESLTPEDAPTFKDELTPNMYAYINVGTLSDTSITFTTTVYNRSVVTVPSATYTLNGSTYSLNNLSQFQGSQRTHISIGINDGLYSFLVDITPVEAEKIEYDNDDILGYEVKNGKIVRHCFPNGTSSVDIDPLLSEQWHIENTGQSAFALYGGVSGVDLNLQEAWEENLTGKGIIVSIIDTGLEICHPELVENVLTEYSYNFVTNTTDTFNPNIYGDHGTSVAGLIAAKKDNGIGGSGVAPQAKIKAYNWLEGSQLLSNRLSSMGISDATSFSEVDIVNQSFGSIPFGDGNIGTTLANAYKTGIDEGRDSKGIIYIKSAGNGFNYCFSSNLEISSSIGCVNSNVDTTHHIPYNIVVGGINAAGNKASYASVGSSLWVTSFAGEYGNTYPAMITTDQMGCNKGYRRTSVGSDALCNFIKSFNGTSSAAPTLSGAVALFLEKYPQLSWRDVKHVLAKTARKVDPDQSAVYYLNESYLAQLPWIDNAAGYHFHNWYGFGLVDVDNAITFLENHTSDDIGEFIETDWHSISNLSIPIADNDATGSISTLEVDTLEVVDTLEAVDPSEHNIEAVVLRISVEHPFTYDLGIHLISPQGTESILNPIANEVLLKDKDLSNWNLLTNAFYGENPQGNWQLKVVDAFLHDSGEIKNWALKFYLGKHKNL